MTRHRRWVRKTMAQIKREWVFEQLCTEQDRIASLRIKGLISEDEYLVRFFNIVARRSVLIRQEDEELEAQKSKPKTERYDPKEGF